MQYYEKHYKICNVHPCYIATVVYGNQETWQVKKLRQYRDNYLMEYAIGRYFIHLYYLISPKLVTLFENIKIINMLTKRLLDKIVEKI